MHHPMADVLRTQNEALRKWAGFWTMHHIKRVGDVEVASRCGGNLNIDSTGIARREPCHRAKDELTFLGCMLSTIFAPR
jgi:hypothetical protein